MPGGSQYRFRVSAENQNGVSDPGEPSNNVALPESTSDTTNRRRTSKPGETSTLGGNYY